MRAWNQALACLKATLIPLNAMAVMVPQNPIKALNTPAKKAVSKTLQLLTENPLMIHRLKISEQEREQLLQQMTEQNDEFQPAVELEKENTLIHKAGLFDRFRRERRERRQYIPQRDYFPEQPQYDYYEEPTYPQRDVKMPTAPSEPNIFFNHADMLNPEDWKVKYFDVVVVINKAKTGQKAVIYRKYGGADLPELVTDDVLISTGRETAELSNEDRAALGMELSNHAPTTSYFSNTPTGYFTPFWLHIDHVSGDWEDAAMDHSVFFHPRGIATHRAPIGTEKQLGRRASGACVRMHQGMAGELFWMVRSTGGPVTEGELAQRPLHCKGEGQALNNCLAKDARRKKPSFKDELEMQEVVGFTTLGEDPMIPEFNRNGELTYGPDGLPVMKQGKFKTLIVVENRPVKKN